MTNNQHERLFRISFRGLLSAILLRRSSFSVRMLYGKPDSNSDIDLLIIKNTDKLPIERWTEVKRLIRDRNRIFSVSPLVYTTREIEERLAIKDFFIQEVLEKGEILYG